MRRRSVVIALVAALVVPPGTAAADPGPSGPSPQEATRLTRAWTALPAAGTIGSSPAYVDGSVFYTEDAFPLSDSRGGERISRRDAATGRPLPFAAPAVTTMFLTGPASDGRRIFTISAGAVAQLRAYSLAGRVSWVSPLPGEKVLPQTLVAGPLVITAGELGCATEPEAGCKRTTVSAWQAATGKPAWRRTLTGGSPQLVVAGGKLTVSTATGPARADLTAFDVSTGRRLWTRPKLPAGPLAADTGSIYVAAGDLCALRATDGRRRWCVKDQHYQDVTVAGGRLYAVNDDRDQRITALAADSQDQRITALTTGGRARWSVPASPTGALTVAGGVVYFQHYPADGPVLPHPVDRPTRLVALRAATGERLVELPLSDGYSSGAVAVGGGRVFTSAYLTAVLSFAPA